MEKTVHYEKTLTSEVLFEGRVITLTKDTALLENGKTAEREVVHHHGGACILRTIISLWASFSPSWAMTPK